MEVLPAAVRALMRVEGRFKNLARDFGLSRPGNSSKKQLRILSTLVGTEGSFLQGAFFNPCRAVLSLTPWIPKHSAPNSPVMCQDWSSTSLVVRGSVLFGFLRRLQVFKTSESQISVYQR